MSKAASQNKHQEFLQNSDQLLVQLLQAARAGDKNDAVVIDATTRTKAKTTLNSEQKALNSMASIIGRGGSGAVGAVCHDGDKFLLSTNRPDDEGKVRKLFTFITVVAPAQSGDKGKRKISPQSISKRGKGRSGARGKY